jgi:hypothetical protein
LLRQAAAVKIRDMAVPAPPVRPHRRLSWRRLAVALGAGGVVAGGALGLAAALDSPDSGPAPRDPSQPVVPGRVATAAQTLPGRTSGLPPLRLVLDHPPPGNIGALPVDQQIARLQTLVERQAQPSDLVQLGSAQQAAGEAQAALRSYRAALAHNPGDLAARLGVVMVDGGSGSAGLRRAATTLRAMARQYPASQLVLFNQGWVAAYRGDARQALASWSRTAVLDRATPLGTAARQLASALKHAHRGP